MAKVVAYTDHAKLLQLVYDTDDVAVVSSPRDLLELTCDAVGCAGCTGAHRQLGNAHLMLTFKPGAQALWEPVADGS